MPIEIRNLISSEVHAVHSFLNENGWAHRIGTLSKFEILIASSQKCVVAINGAGDIIGFARAISDGISNGYLSMVVVSTPYRRQGIGKALVKLIIAVAAELTWVLRAGREGATEFFTALGFKTSSIAMEKLRT